VMELRPRARHVTFLIQNLQKMPSFKTAPFL